MPTLTHDLAPARGRAKTGYTTTIAANGSLGRGSGKEDLDLDQLDWTQYMRNPVVLWRHGFTDEGLPIGRTLRLWRENGEIKAEFEFAPDEFAQRVKKLWDQDFIRAATIRWDPDENGRPYLVEWSLTPIGADPDALRGRDEYGRLVTSWLRDGTEPKEKEMEEDKIRELIAAALKDKQTEDERMTAMTGAIAEAVKGVTTERDAAIAERDAAKAELEKQKPPADPPADPPAGETTLEKQVEEAVAKAEQEAEAKYELAASARELLPDDFDVKGSKVRDILLAAAGDEVEDKDKKSDDYLRASVDGILARRREAGQGGAPSGSGPAPAMRASSVYDLMARKRDQASQ